MRRSADALRLGPLARASAFGAIEARGLGLGRRRGAAVLPGHIGACSEQARHQAGQRQVDVERRPMQAVTPAGNRDRRELLVAGPFQPLREARRESEDAAIGQLDDDPARACVISRRTGSRFALACDAAAFERVVVGQVSHGALSSARERPLDGP
jgi:hypothetical protein